MASWNIQYNPLPKVQYHPIPSNSIHYHRTQQFQSSKVMTFYSSEVLTCQSLNKQGFENLRLSKFQRCNILKLTLPNHKLLVFSNAGQFSRFEILCFSQNIILWQVALFSFLHVLSTSAWHVGTKVPKHVDIRKFEVICRK